MSSQTQRIDAVLARREPDRTPILGGWIACPEHLCAVTGSTLDEYWRDPEGVSLCAYASLGTDGLLALFVPKSRDDFRCVDGETYLHAKRDMTLDEALAHIDALPDAAEIIGSFDFASECEVFISELLRMRARCGEMMWMPAQWRAGAKVTWYGELGYENFFLIVAGYPERAAKLMRIGGAQGHPLDLAQPLTVFSVQLGMPDVLQEGLPGQRLVGFLFPGLPFCLDRLLVTHLYGARRTAKMQSVVEQLPHNDCISRSSRVT